MQRLHIRPLSTFAELDAGVEMQRQTWGRHFDDIVSAALMRVSQKIGGVSAGAFDGDGELVGLLFGLTGVREGALVHWSHMLAVKTDWQGKGLGTILKAYQRRRVMAIGVEKMFWTFDPLEARNAHFNINRLGVQVDDYIPDMYGSGDTSPMHRGIGTDRFIAVWPLQAVGDRMSPTDDALTWDESGMEADVALPAPSPEGARGYDKHLLESAISGSDSDGFAFVEIPGDIQRLKAERPDEASSWRTLTRTAFTHYLGEGMAVSGFLRDPASGRCFYVLAHPTKT